ncbi:hypothetical protein V1512DRAFT_27323 [Lipomyces arxii]|uniref:uncharacterized protein n=1 Tax=Lipomyces arxii TaxID=56418 RepID=UPI0034CECFA8
MSSTTRERPERHRTLLNEKVPKHSPPGPIPAAPPSLVRRDEHGVDWIAFQYSKDRVRTEYCIRCDVDTVDVSILSKPFRRANCIYPRADVNDETKYYGNRQKYESECNRIGWALTHLNPSLRNRRGLIQRAVDSWRNSNADPEVRSRRVRRIYKQQQLKQTENDSNGSPAIDNTRVSSTSEAPSILNTDLNRLDSLDSYIVNPLQFPTSQLLDPALAVESPPSMKTRTSTFRYTSANRKTMKYIILHKNIPNNEISTETKPARIRVRVSVGDVNMEQIPDKYRLDNAVYPRSVIPVLSAQFQHLNTESATLLEQELNEIGIKIAWLQPRTFEGKIQYLQRVLDVYRSKLSVFASTNDGSTRLMLRPGKNLWIARTHSQSGPAK